MVQNEMFLLPTGVRRWWCWLDNPDGTRTVAGPYRAKTDYEARRLASIELGCSNQTLSSRVALVYKGMIAIAPAGSPKLER